MDVNQGGMNRNRTQYKFRRAVKRNADQMLVASNALWPTIPNFWAHPIAPPVDKQFRVLNVKLFRFSICVVVVNTRNCQLPSSKIT